MATTDVHGMATVRDVERALEAMGRALGDRDAKIEALTTRLDGQSETIKSLLTQQAAIHTRLDVQRGILRSDPINMPRPATSAPEPIQAPETPDALAARLLADPEMLARLIVAVATDACQNVRLAVHDEIKQFARSQHIATSLRLLAATIAAGSFGK